MKWSAAASLLLLPFLAHAQLEYTVEPDVPAKSIRVAIAVRAPGKEPEFRLPAWCPGWYVLTDSEKKISDVRATDLRGKELKITHKDPHEWEVANPEGTAVTFSYRVLGDEPGLGSDRVHVDDRTAFVNSPAALMYLNGRLKDAAALSVELPEGWDVATAMDSSAKHRFTAKDYDELIDSPIQMGILHRKSFSIKGIPFEAVYVTSGKTVAPDLAYETERLRKLSVAVYETFGKASFRHYTYVVHLASGLFGGGLEHRACTVLDVGNYKPLEMDELAAHEFFHAWNVKQIRAKVLGPFDYSKPCRTKTLWFLEGVTDYYAHLCVYRSGLGSEERLLRNLGAEIDMLQHSRTREKKTLEEACWETWEHGGFGYDDLSYYNKGLVVGLLLDEAVREATGSAKSLDDVMRYMYGKYQMPNPGYEEDGILLALNKVAGKDLSALYHKLLQTTEELPYERLAGLGLRLLKPEGEYDEWGLKLNGPEVVEVTDEQAKCGLAKGDRVVQMRRASAKDTYELEVKRAGKAVTLVLPLHRFTASRFRLETDPFAGPVQKQRMAKWLAR